MADSGRFSIIPARALDDTRLNAAPLKLLALLGTYSNRDGWCWPSIGKMAERLGQTPRNIQKNAATLKDLGYIRVKPTDGGVNHYKVLHDADLPQQFDRMKQETHEPDVHTPHELLRPTPERERQGGGERDVRMNVPIERTQEKTVAADAAEYAFEGRVIRLKPKDYLRWQRAYPAIPDFTAELQSLDDYYAVNLEPKERRNWFCRASTALKKANTRALSDARANGNGAKRKRRNLLDEIPAAESPEGNPELGATSEQQYRRLI